MIMQNDNSIDTKINSKKFKCSLRICAFILRNLIQIRKTVTDFSGAAYNRIGITNSNTVRNQRTTVVNKNMPRKNTCSHG